MRRSTWSLVCIVAVLCVWLVAPLAMADDEDNRLSVSVAFGRGLNTAQPGNAVNHAILPDNIKVAQDGVVHFLVAGFHQVVVYNPGKDLDDLVVPPSGTFINDPTNRFYQGITPAGGPPPGLPITTDPSNARNRVESVSFPEPGTYLVICNVRQHFLDGMFAFIKVKEDD
jgi:hypothetical protein